MLARIFMGFLEAVVMGRTGNYFILKNFMGFYDIVRSNMVHEKHELV